MDGPNVNLQFLELFQQEYAERYGGSQLVAVGSFGLHTLHGAVKSDFHVASRETAESHAHIVPQCASKERRLHCYISPPSFLYLSVVIGGLKTQPVTERALEVWPSFIQFMDWVRRKQLPHPGTASFDNVEEAMKDTHRGKATLLLDCCQAFQSVFEEVSDR
ncbi:hypothetical protein GOODEAATRI_032541 [Goodea atripinnis]|uniref:Uncharacterized protein n=1 Tax=Goodea atripinnis TaxID=208336 RepID=A0ABV0Q2W4_9TELE